MKIDPEALSIINGAVEKAVSEERKRCAELAEKIGKEYGEPAIGYSIAKQILTQQSR